MRQDDRWIGLLRISDRACVSKTPSGGQIRFPSSRSDWIWIQVIVQRNRM